jgi:transposase
LIDQDLSVVFYDLTTVAVTGQTDLDDDVRAYGLAKSGLIERQFMLSLVQTAEGLPIAHEVHPGNTAEAKTLLPMIRGLLARYPLKRVVLIADRGLLSTANIDELVHRSIKTNTY